MLAVCEECQKDKKNKKCTDCKKLDDFYWELIRNENN